MFQVLCLRGAWTVQSQQILLRLSPLKANKQANKLYSKQIPKLCYCSKSHLWMLKAQFLSSLRSVEASLWSLTSYTVNMLHWKDSKVLGSWASVYSVKPTVHTANAPHSLLRKNSNSLLLPVSLLDLLLSLILSSHLPDVMVSFAMQSVGCLHWDLWPANNMAV